MRLGILGPLLVADDRGTTVSVAATRQRTLLAALLVRQSRIVPLDQLSEFVWDGAPPCGAPRTVRSYVARLRHAVGPELAARITTRYPGYLFQVAEEEFDVLQFDALCDQGGAAVRAQQWARAGELLTRATGLWRGAPLTDVPSQLLRGECVEHMEQARLQALEWRIEADLHLGRHGQLIPELQRLVGEHPLREHVHAQLMLALYRCGRQAEALEAYRRARRVLVEELGIEPGKELRTLQEGILAEDATLFDTRPGRAPNPLATPSPLTTTEEAGLAAPELLAVPELVVAAPVPRQLPAGVRRFVGRAAELARLDRLTGEATDGAGAVVISLISGTAGVGKTALAVHWARRAAGAFPDGQLYVNLRGFDPSADPVEPEQAIRGFLEALGVPPDQVPGGLQAQAGLYRSILVGKKLLVMLDNARDEGQVRPLLPATDDCLVLVTSRNQLIGLVAAHDAVPLSLDPLADTDARDLLTSRVGAGRVAAEPAAVTELIDSCARLPLALAIATARAATCGTGSLGALAAELRDTNDRLAVLSTGDPATSVRAAFSCSYRHLTPAAARLFRLAGLHPGPGITDHAAASLGAVHAREARVLLAELARAHLLTQCAPGRYTFHDLLRAYATEQARALETPEARRAALSRLFDHYLAAAATAMDALIPAERHHRIPAERHPAGRHHRPQRPSLPAPPSVETPDAARAWLDIERATLVAVSAHAAANGWPDHAIGLSAILFRYLNYGGYVADAHAVFAHALRAARRTGDRAAQADALRSLGAADRWQGQYHRAADHYWQAFALYRELGDRFGQARTRGNIGILLRRQGRYAQAADQLRQALDLYCALGDVFYQAMATYNLGTVECDQGLYEQAADHHRMALALCRELGHREGEAGALHGLAVVMQRQGQFAQATDHLRLALGLYGETGYRRMEAEALNNVGDLLRQQGCHERAATHHRQALHLHRELGDRSGQATALNSLGETAAATGDPEQARVYHVAALTIADQINDRHQQARARDGLAAANPAQPGSAADRSA